MFLDPNGLEILPTERCRELVEQHEVGRLGFVDNDQVTVLPVTYGVLDEQLLIRTNDGSKLAAAVAERHVALEIDDVDQRRHTGWSVLARGTMTLVDDPEEVARIDAAQLHVWGPIGSNYVRIPLDNLTGRALRVGPRATDRPTPPTPKADDEAID